MRVFGHSMAPVLRPGQLVLIDQEAYRGRQPRRGEIVVARPSGLGGRAFVKRVVGLPREQVRLGARTWALGAEEFFLLGDQQEQSMDSRIFGPVRLEELVGSVRARIWPWKRLTPTSSTAGEAVTRDIHLESP